MPDDQVRLEVQRFGWDRWDAARMGMEVAAIGGLGHRGGAFRFTAESSASSRTSRAAAARPRRGSRTHVQHSNRKHIGWAMWDYQGSFALVTKGQQGTVADPAILNALGLKK